MKKHHMSEAGVSFENLVWSVYHDMGWRTHFYIRQQTIVLNMFGQGYPYNSKTTANPFLLTYIAYILRKNITNLKQRFWLSQ